MLHSLLLIVALHFSPHRADVPAVPKATPAPAVGPASQPVADGLIVSITPKEIRGAVGELIPIKAESGAEFVTWRATEGLKILNDEPPDPARKSILVHAKEGGTYAICASIPFEKGTRSAITLVTIGPRPPPVPPGPTPQPDIVPPIPALGFRVLIVYETGDLPKYPKGQLATLYGKEVRDYLSAKCVKGDDGKTAEWRIWDADVSTAGESKLWQDAMKRPRGKPPTILISDGKTGYEGPLPNTIEETLSLLKRYGG